MDEDDFAWFSSKISAVHYFSIDLVVSRAFYRSVLEKIHAVFCLHFFQQPATRITLSCMFCVMGI